jgi:hypothetical protein
MKLSEFIADLKSRPPGSLPTQVEAAFIRMYLSVAAGTEICFECGDRIGDEAGMRMIAYDGLDIADVIAVAAFCPRCARGMDRDPERETRQRRRLAFIATQRSEGSA